jgi:hypothetical protein
VWVGRGQENFLDIDGTAVFSIDGSARGRPDRVVDLMLPWHCRPARPGPPNGERDGAALPGGRPDARGVTADLTADR